MKNGDKYPLLFEAKKGEKEDNGVGEKGIILLTYKKRGQMHFSLQRERKETSEKSPRLFLSFFLSFSLFHTHALSSLVMITSCERE